MPTSNNPYAGPRPYEQHEKTLFFGRDQEANELFSLICAHRVILFYSQSGAGKTSLLNAAIIPKLKAHHDEVFGVARVGGKLPKDVDEKYLSNVFVFNALLSLQGERKQFSYEDLSKMSLTEYLGSQQRSDQRKYFYPLHVVIFDQFEELFTSFPRHQLQQESFFVNVSKALQADPFLRVVFAMREEYIASLDPFALMLPERFRRRFRLERLRKEAAQRAVEGPLEGTTRSFGPRVAESLVNNLMQVPIKHVGGTVSAAGEYVEPVQLQIVCHSLWEVLPANVRVIDQRAVAEFGDVDNALAKYYSDALKKVVETSKKVDKRDVEERGLRIWFEKSLITPIGTRGTVYMDEGRTEDDLSEPTVKMLEEYRLIRPELRGGAKWYELTHDRFIEPIRNSNKEWFESLPADDQLIIKIEQKANAWEQKGRLGEELLTDEELLKIQQAWERHSNLKDKAIGTLKAYVDASKAAFDKRQLHAVLRQRRVALWIIAAIVLAIIGLASYSSIRAWQARRMRRDAQMRKADLAKEFAGVKGKEYDALAFGIEAVGPPGDNPPGEAVEGLRKALAVIDSKIWLREGAGIPNRLELSADGRLALTMSSSEFFIWDAVTGEPLSLSGHPAPRDGTWRKVSFSPDGKLVYAISAPLERDPNQGMVEQDIASPLPINANARTVRILDPRSGVPLEDLQAKLKDARGMTISEDGRYILADLTGDVRIIEIASQTVSPSFPAAQLQWRQIALSPDGSRLVAVYADSRVGILAAVSGKTIGGFDVGVPKGRERDFIAFSLDGKRVVLARTSTTPEDTAAVIWDGSGGQPIASLKLSIGGATYVAFSQDGNSAVIIGKNWAAIYDVSQRKPPIQRPLPQGIVAQYSGTNVLFIHNENGTCKIYVWNALTGETKVLAQADATKYKITKAALTPDASRVITASEDNVIQVWTVGETLDVTKMSRDELMRGACAKLRDTKREYEYAQVSDLCKSYLQGP
jgi:WD40 repeat protein